MGGRLKLQAIGGGQRGRSSCRKVHCPLTTLLDAQGPNPEKAMQLEKMRIVMDRSGIKRLEACEDNALLAKAKRAPIPHIGHH